MRVLLSAAGRAFLREAIVAFVVFAAGIWAAPNVDAAAALAFAGSYAALAAGFRAVRVFLPGISTAVAGALHVPVAYAEVIITGTTTVLSGLLVGAIGFFEAPDFETGKAAFIAAILGIGTALFRLIQAVLTPGETPTPSAGIGTPPQPVPPEALPATLPTNV